MDVLALLWLCSRSGAAEVLCVSLLEQAIPMKGRQKRFGDGGK